MLSPDVINLDLDIAQGPITRSVSDVVTAVLVQAQSTGAVILAEGIETAHDLTTAMSWGATLGQLAVRPQVLGVSPVNVRRFNCAG